MKTLIRGALVGYAVYKAATYLEDRKNRKKIRKFVKENFNIPS